MKELLKQLTPGERDWTLAAQLDVKRLPAHVESIGTELAFTMNEQLLRVGR